MNFVPSLFATALTLAGLAGYASLQRRIRINDLLALHGVRAKRASDAEGEIYRHGKVRFVFREFALDGKAAAASMLARCIAGDDASKYFDAVSHLFRRQDRLIKHAQDTLKLIGKQQSGMSEEAVETCEKDQTLLDKLSADQKFAFKKLKVDVTPTFFINGEKVKGAMTFEQLDKKIGSLLGK
ncbi:MAG: hypothetical protein NVSMB20_08940 [Bradyrhizobium sp.]